MDKEKFAAILELIVPQVIFELKKQNGNLNVKDIDMFYSSRLYNELENEETKLWHYSPLTLKNMYCEETNKGYINYPEET